jgi:cytidylate kinase
MGREIIIAIDGPAGSGKSTIAKNVAFHFGYIYIDTGAMYRAITLKALRNNILLSDNRALTLLAENTSLKFQYVTTGSDSKMYLWMDDSDVTVPIRSLEVTQNVSEVAAIPGVRAALVKSQQKMAQQGGVVMDGRDIGTVVFPDAELKIFLSASVEERTQRRWLELQEKGTIVALEDLRQQIMARDHYDSHREADPLRQAEDAYFLDTTALTIDEVAAKVIELAIQRGAEKKLKVKRLSI